MNKHWTETEMEVLRNEYRQQGPTILAEKLGRTMISIQRKAYYMGLTKREPGQMTVAEIAQLRKIHEEGKHKSRLQSPEYHEKRRKIVLASSRKRRERKRAERVCIRCSKPSMENNSQYCMLHWAATSMGYTCRRQDEAFAKLLLEKLEAQNYRCALTGDLLIPGYNCSLDHIVHKSKGGKLDDLDNLRWVTIDANRARGTLEDDEFVAMCQRVINHLS